MSSLNGNSKRHMPNFPHFDVDWEWYGSSRGNYPPEHILELARQYHCDNAFVEGEPIWERAIDVGAGMGMFGVHLLRDYNQVVLYEPDIDHLREAQRRHWMDNRISCKCSRAEDMLLNTKRGSADMISVANSVNFMEPARSIANFYEVLAPGGTLMISQYGDMPFLSDYQPHVTKESGLDAKSAQVELDVLFVETMSEQIKEMRINLGQAADYSLALLRSRLDALDFPLDRWKSVRRYHWYKGRDVIPAEGFDDKNIPPLSSNVNDKELVFRSKKDVMYTDVDFAWICSYMQNEGLLLERHKCAEELVHLEEEMGDAKWRLVWPYDLILATKRENVFKVACENS